MKVLPVNLLLEGRLAVVVGAGPVAARKAARLLAAGARVRVVAERFSKAFESLEGVERVTGTYARDHLSGASLVVAATDGDEVNARVASDARAAGVPVNVVDTPDQCDFFFPAVTQKGDVAIAVSTGGASPTLAKMIKNEIAESLDEEYAGLARILGAVRLRAMEEIPDGDERREFFETLADNAFLQILKTRGYEEALAEAVSILEQRTAAAKGKAQ